ncbi:HNH endonuclease [Roseburia sp. 1XD42-34]|nr:HNH endonuclease [Roseburia sp. 1XD42-34]
MDYSYRAMHAATAASGDYLTTGEFSTIEHQVVSKLKVSDYKREWHGVYYTLADGRKIREYKSKTGDVQYEITDTIPENRWKPREPNKGWLDRKVKDIGETGGKLVKGTIDFLFWDDVKTVMDGGSTKGEKVIAGASLVPIGKIAGKAWKLIKGEGKLKLGNEKTGKIVTRTKGNSVRIINKKYAGKTYNLSGDLAKKYPNGVKFTKEGFPDFSPYSKVSIKIDGLKGNTSSDFTAANKSIGLKATPKGYTWHHVEDGRTLMLVPTDLHQSVRHTGGAALIRKGLAP